MCCGGKGGGRSGGRSRRLKPRTAKDVKAQMIKEYRAHILMCRPKYYGINYSINPWMNTDIGADHNKSIDQWRTLESKIRQLDAEVSYIPPREGLPDMVFTANAGLFLDNGVFILASFKHKERQGEEDHFEKWFVDRGLTVHRIEHEFEGAGDALYLNDKLIGGHGFRTDPLAYERYFFKADVLAELVDPYFYHLDTCFCPLKDGDYLIWPGAFSEEGLKNIRNVGGNEISVIEPEAKQFACNAVVIGRDVILPTECPDTMQKLRQAGYTPHAVEMSEFIKSGGACKCLTLALTT
jgi:N-dimethylarginine dimethylaminohydrolase